MFTLVIALDTERLQLRAWDMDDRLLHENCSTQRYSAEKQQTIIFYGNMIMKDSEVMSHIETLIAEEQRLYHQSHLSDTEKLELESLQVQLDQYWDLLRQRRALRNAGDDPDQAQLRGPDIVENYEQ
jgi:hypothetical protein